MASSYKKTIVLGMDSSDFTKGIAECNKEMKALDAEFKMTDEQLKNTGDSTERYANKLKYLGEKIDTQKQKVDLAKKKYEEMKYSQADTSAIEKARLAWMNEETTLARLEGQYTQTSVAMSNIKAKGAAMVATLTAISAAMIECAKGAAEWADNMETLSMQTGVSVQTLQEWDYASELMDTSLETITSSFSKLEKAMKTNEAAFDALGVKVKDAHGNFLSAEQVFLQTIDALGQIENATARDQAAMDIFGKSARELSGVINAGSAGLKEYAAEAHQLGRIMSNDEVQAASELSDAVYRLNEAFEATKNKIGADLAPLLTALLNVINKIPTPIMEIIAVTTALAAGISSVVMFVNAAKVAYTGLLPSMKAVTAEMMLQGGYIGILVGLVVALAVAISKLVGEYKSLQEEMDKYGLKNDFGSIMRLTIKKEATDATTGQVYHFAKGGTTPGGPVWVGENGPELVNLPNGSRVYDSQESRQIGGSTTYNITMNCDLSKMKTVNDVVEAVTGLKNSIAGGA